MPKETRQKAAGYCGIENVKFAPKQADGSYATELLWFKYAKSLSLTPQVSSTEQHADNRLLFKVPSDTGYTGELGTTAADPELEKLAGHAMEGASGLIGVDMTSYLRGAMYFEHIIYEETAKAKRVKVWLFNVEVGKGAETYNTKQNSLELGAYAYPVTVVGDKAMAADGTTEYVDEYGMGHTAFRLASYPGDADYATFGDAVPVPKVKAVDATTDDGTGDEAAE